ncbi:MAG TPA: pirin family protein [Nitrososphaera sp.]|nr:pirin family protein [Nitrososphaera sp.]
MIKIIKSGEHYHNEEDWLSTYWHFSFAHYQDPSKMNFGPLRVFNDDIIQPGTGFGFHPHRDMEIVTYVIDGELEHKDNQGNQGVIRSGEIQRMTAGSGIMHSEYNHSKERPLRLLQMWLFANRRGLEPSWEQRRFDKAARSNKLLPVIVPEDVQDGQALHIHQDAAIYVSSLAPGSRVGHTLAKGRKAYVFVIEGSAKLNGNPMETRDAARIENESNFTIQAGEPAELILLDLPEKYAINS